jgi:hypothetical protein
LSNSSCEASQVQISAGPDQCAVVESALLDAPSIEAHWLGVSHGVEAGAVEHEIRRMLPIVGARKALRPYRVVVDRVASFDAPLHVSAHRGRLVGCDVERVSCERDGRHPIVSRAGIFVSLPDASQVETDALDAPGEVPRVRLLRGPVRTRHHQVVAVQRECGHAIVLGRGIVLEQPAHRRCLRLPVRRGAIAAEARGDQRRADDRSSRAPPPTHRRRSGRRATHSLLSQLYPLGGGAVRPIHAVSITIIL